MKKVIHIITGLGNGGAEGVLFRLASNDSNSRHIVISLMNEGKYGRLLKDNNIEVICLNMPRGKVTVKGGLTLWKCIRSHNPDIVQTWMYHADLFGGVIARLAGVTKVYWNIRHTELIPGQSSKATIIISRICALLSSFVPTKIISCAEKSVQTHSSIGYKKDKFIVIGNGYDIARFVPDAELGSEVRSNLKISSDIVLGMVGRFNPQKDHKNLLSSVSMLKQKGVAFSLLLIGPGIDKENFELNKWIKNYYLSDNILLLGERSDIPAIMNALDIHILSSSFGEAFPNVLAEAMACGKPCVSTDVGDAAYILGDTGWIAERENTKALFHSLSLALAERVDRPEDWLLRKKHCRERIVQNFSVEIMIDKYYRAWGLCKQH